MLLSNLAVRSPSRRQAIHSAGGIPPIVHAMQHCSSDADLRLDSLELLHLLAASSAERCQAIAEAGGVAACVHVFACPRSADCTAAAASLLCILTLAGHSRAIVAADPSCAVEAALQELRPRLASSQDSQVLHDALRTLAYARQPAQARGAAGAAALAPAEQAAREPDSSAGSQSSDLVCAAPGCGATQGLRRCGACGDLSYCSTAYQVSHWRCTAWSASSRVQSAGLLRPATAAMGGLDNLD